VIGIAIDSGKRTGSTRRIRNANERRIEIESANGIGNRMADGPQQPLRWSFPCPRPAPPTKRRRRSTRRSSSVA